MPLFLHSIDVEVCHSHLVWRDTFSALLLLLHSWVPLFGSWMIKKTKWVYVHIVWNFQNFSATQSYLESIMAKWRVSKTGILWFRGSEFWFLGIFSSDKMLKFTKTIFQKCRNSQNSRFLDLGLTEIDFNVKSEWWENYHFQNPF